MIPDRPKPPPIKESGNPPSLEKYFQLPYFTPEMEFKDSISAKVGW